MASISIAWWKHEKAFPKIKTDQRTDFFVRLYHEDSSTKNECFIDFSETRMVKKLLKKREQNNKKEQFDGMHRRQRQKMKPNVACFKVTNLKLKWHSKHDDVALKEEKSNFDLSFPLSPRTFHDFLKLRFRCFVPRKIKFFLAKTFEWVSRYEEIKFSQI